MTFNHSATSHRTWALSTSAAILKRSAALLLIGAAATGLAHADPATEATIKANKAVEAALPFSDRSEFADATRGLLRKPETLTIRNDKGAVVWDLETYKKFIKDGAPAPDTVNPSLWRNAQLNLQHGLFEVTNGIYQVRGYDLANITFIRGDTGWIVFDTGTTVETAKAAMDLVNQQFGKLPVVAIVYSHPHLDHYGGARGIIDPQDVKSGKVRVIAPEGFMEHAVSENVMAGNAMSRRATYMFGALLNRGPEGSVGSGLGITNPIGVYSLVPPTEYISKTGETLTIDGVEMVFQMTPGTEAPAEMNIYLPKQRAMWMAENTTATMHNILTPRGAQVRDALSWAKYINQTIDLYGDKVDVKFQSHHWPMWGKEKIGDYLSKQRDLYKFIHDRSVNLMNKGYNGEEISEIIKLPASLETFWPGRGYYGTLRHNSRAVYQRYMGWYDGNPSNLNNLPPVEISKRYVDYMGGDAAVLKRAQADYDKGEYRWVASVLRNVVFANPDNKEARDLLARAYEQLGYQAESGPWRSIYLQGATELRKGLPDLSSGGSASADIVRAMTPEMLFDFLGVRLNAEKADGQTLAIAINFPDLKKSYTLSLNNSVLNYSDKPGKPVDATFTLNKSTLDDINLGVATLESKVKSGDIKIDGDPKAFARLMGMMDRFSPNFNIVTP